MNPVTHRIIDTKPDGRVRLTQPKAALFRAFSNGGVGPDDNSLFHDCMHIRGFAREQVRRHIERGVSPDIARKWVDAMQFGGMTSGESWGLFFGYSCFDGTDHDVIAVSDLPNKWFRNAWRRGRSGRITIDMNVARTLQRDHVLRAVTDWNKQAGEENSNLRWIGRNSNGPSFIYWEEVEPLLIQKSLDAKSPDELCRVWPDELIHPLATIQ